MKITVERRALADALSAGRTIYAISHILLKAERNAITIQATDGELSIALVAEARIDVPGSAIVPKGIAAIVKAMAGADVTLEGDGGKLTVASGAMSVELVTLPPSEFPEIPGPVGGTVGRFGDEALATAQRLLPAVGRDFSRPVLSGVYVSRMSGTETLAATDSYRMAVWSGGKHDGEGIAAIVPLRAWQEASRLTAKSLEVGDKLATFHLANGTLTTRLIDGKFPDWQTLIPTPEAWAEVEREALLATINRIGLVVGKAGDPVRVKFDADHITVTASGQLGTGQETVAASYAGEPMECGYNPAFLIDGLRAIDGEKARIGLVSALRPALIEGDEGGIRYLIMPVRLNTCGPRPPGRSASSRPTSASLSRRPSSGP